MEMKSHTIHLSDGKGRKAIEITLEVCEDSSGESCREWLYVKKDGKFLISIFPEGESTDILFIMKDFADSGDLYIDEKPVISSGPYHHIKICEKTA